VTTCAAESLHSSAGALPTTLTSHDSVLAQAVFDGKAIPPMMRSFGIPRVVQIWCAALALLFVVVPALLAQSTNQRAQQSTAKSSAQSPAPAASESKVGEAPGVLVQLNQALEGLAAKVSPAVVQIVVTGFGPIREEEKSRTALIVRQRDVVSGVIVDPIGYIISNSHVGEGAQQILVALPLSGGDSSLLVPIWLGRFVEALMLGLH
jgi:S1-C subfamily serine protease